MRFQAIITAGGRQYTIVTGEFDNAADALQAVRHDIIVGEGVFIMDNSAVEINCRSDYQAIEIYPTDAPQLPAIEPTEADQVRREEKEYGLANISDLDYLGQGMDVSLLVYYAKNHMVLMPSVINGSHAYGYMAEKNVVELMHKIAQTRLQLTPDQYTVLLYPGPLLDMQDGVEYLREWAKSREQDIYIPKIKMQKPFTAGMKRGKKL